MGERGPFPVVRECKPSQLTLRCLQDGIRVPVGVPGDCGPGDEGVEDRRTWRNLSCVLKALQSWSGGGRDSRWERMVQAEATG